MTHYTHKILLCKKTIILLLTIYFFETAYASESYINWQPANYEHVSVNALVNKANIGVLDSHNDTSIYIKIPIQAMSDLIGAIQSSICSKKNMKQHVKEIKFQLSIDTSGKIYIVGADGQLGVEVTLNCN